MAADDNQHDAWFSSRAILTSLNTAALHVNNMIVDQLDPGTEHVALSSDSITDSGSVEATNFQQEFLNNLCPSGSPPH